MLYLNHQERGTLILPSLCIFCITAMGGWARAPVLLVVCAVLPCAADAVEVLYRHRFAEPRCESEPVETMPIALINECFISCEGNVPRHQTMDSETCGKKCASLETSCCVYQQYRTLLKGQSTFHLWGFHRTALHRRFGKRLVTHETLTLLHVVCRVSPTSMCPYFGICFIHHLYCTPDYSF